MKVKDFDKLGFDAQYKAAIFGGEKEVEEAKLAGKLFKSSAGSKGADFALHYFEKLAGIVQHQPEHSKKKLCARLLKKAEEAVAANKASLPADVAQRIEACVTIGKNAEKARKESKGGSKQARSATELVLAGSAAAGKFPEGAAPLHTLKAVASNKDALSKLHARVREQTKGTPLLKANAVKNNPANSYRGVELKSTNIFGNQRFIFTHCPKTPKATAILFDELLSNRGALFVSTLESHEATKNHENGFWKKERVEKLALRAGWTVRHVGETLIAKGARPSEKLLETTIQATNGAESRTLSHLHYDGWVDHHPAGDEGLLMTMLLRMKEIQKDATGPISINCKGGVGRTGITGLTFELMRDVDRQLAAGKKLDEVTLNVAESYYNMCIQGRAIISKSTQFAQVYRMMHAYYEHLKKEQAASWQLASALPAITGLPPGPVTNLIAAYAQ